MTTLNVLVPMAGKGTRFAFAGYGVPKPLIPVQGKPMVARALENITEGVAARVVLICAEADCHRHPALNEVLEALSTEVLRLHPRPVSPMHSFLAGAKSLSGDAPVLSLNCDQYISMTGAELCRRFWASGADVAAFTMVADGPSYGRVEMNPDSGRITRVLGKSADRARPALTGLYLFKSPELAIRLAEGALKESTSGEVCISAALAVAIRLGLAVVGLPLGEEGEVCSILGDPESLERFNQHQRNKS